MHHLPHTIIRLSRPALLAAMAWLGVQSAMADDITLRQSAALPAGEIRLRDIATLQGDAALPLADTLVGRIDKANVSISMQDIRAKLDGKGVNWGRLSLRGFMACQVTLQPASAEVQPVAASSEPGSSSAALANPSGPVASDSAMTLRDRVMEELVRHTGVPADDLRVTFSPRDAQSLAQSVLADRWEIEPANAARLGRVLLTVRQWRGEQVVQTHRLSVDIARRTLAVVAAQPIRRGQAITAGDVEIQEVYLSQAHRAPATDLQAVIGKVAVDPVSKGQVMFAENAARPDLVSRGDRLMVRCVVGGLVVKIGARAIEAGAMGDVITVANLDSNERFKARITASREAVLVQPSSDGKGSSNE